MDEFSSLLFYLFFGCFGSSLLCAGFLHLRWLLLLRSTGSRLTGFSSCGAQAQQLWLAGSRARAQQLWCTGSRARGLQQLWLAGLVGVACGLQSAGSVVVAHGLSCSAACGIFPDQGLNPCPLHWQVDSQPLRHQGSPAGGFLTTVSPRKSQLVFVY